MSDPYLTLGVTPTATDADIEAAYRAGVKRYPPEHHPQRFEALRSAYETLRTRHDRLSYELFDTTPPTLGDILDKAAPVGKPRRPGPSQFAALLRGGS
ncbi:J domain-containing protein [Halovibrio sp. HP20-50]|uniref:J domain-containing protein n=1 Tax=Halovibrio sp. HP20-59 TaxID=3080275 RepID=UPI00294AFA51|nr:J domain-containing protein [Halovibrio sp. HP20-59]MEA2119758.1 J domain-containing protein [Halovibrio sp. HP20-59]